MLNLKKTAIAVLALGSSAAFAGTMGPVCSAVNVTVPCESTAWDFGIKALYIQKAGESITESKGSFLDSSPLALPATSISGDQTPDYHWGFSLEGSYHFNTGNDLNINWSHLNYSTSGTIDPYVASPTVPLLGSIDVSTGEIAYQFEPKWDSVNLELGQTVNFGENKSIRFHGGLGFAHLGSTSSASGEADIGKDLTSNINFLLAIGDSPRITPVGGALIPQPPFLGKGKHGKPGDPNPGLMALSAFLGSFLDASDIAIPATGFDPFTFALDDSAGGSASFTSSFNGVGPRVGSEFDYEVGNGLSVYAEGAVALMTGNKKQSATFTSSTGADLWSGNNTRVIVVPEIDSKIGASYDYATSQGDLSLDAGWMFTTYFYSNSLAADKVSLQGPYVGLKFIGNVA